MPESGSGGETDAGGQRSAGSSRFVWLWVLGLILGSVACTPEPEDPSLSLSQSDRTALAAFIAELSEVYSRGDSRGVEALIEGDSDDRVVGLARKRVLPKGPSKIVGHRIVPYANPEGPLFRFEGVEYEHTIEPLGKLILEVEDVSIGPVQVGFVVGQRDGVFRIAGMQSIQ